MTVVILVAGSGRRFRDENPKCLSTVKGGTLLERTIGLIREIDDSVPIRLVTGYKSSSIEELLEGMDVEGVTVIKNLEYENDQNIISAQRGSSEVDSDVLILEGDCIFNEVSMEAFISSIGSNKNTIFSIGDVDLNLKNAVVKSDENGNFAGFTMGERNPEMDLSKWSNMSGAVLFSERDLTQINNWLDKSGADPAKTYYFQPLIEGELEVKITRLGDEAEFSTFNTQKQYLEIMAEMGVETEIKLVETEKLLHVEGFSEKRVLWLRNKIEEDGVWNKPICIDYEFGIVMDGQHRMEVAKAMGLTVIPAIGFTHSEVDFWSLRPKSHEVTLELIMSKSLSGDVYPYKTVKYSFPTEIPECSIDLEELY